MQHQKNLRNLASWKHFAVLGLLFLLLSIGFRWRDLCMGGKYSLDGKIFEFYTPAEAKCLLDKMGEHGRIIYAGTELSLDLLFPLVYAGLMTIILQKTFSNAKYLFFIPVLTVAADLIENLIIAIIAFTYDGTEPQLAQAASFFTFAKWTGVLSFGILSIGGIGSKAWKTILRRRHV